MLSGIVFQFVLSWLYSLSAAAMETGRVTTVADAAEIDRKLETLRGQMGLGLNGITGSWVFMIAGFLLLMTGVYQNARATERLEQSLLSGGSPRENSGGGA